MRSSLSNDHFRSRRIIGHKVVKQETAPLGVRLVVEGPLTLRDGAVAQIRSVWFIESGERVARLVTAYPLRQRKRI